MAHTQLDVDLIFNERTPSARARLQAPRGDFAAPYPKELLRQKSALLPEQSELQTVRHFRRGCDIS